MIRGLGHEMGVPSGVHPDLIGPEPDNHYYWGMGPGTPERPKESVRWRRKIIAEMERRPEWIAEWRAERDLHRRIRELCGIKAGDSSRGTSPVANERRAGRCHTVEGAATTSSAGRRARGRGGTCTPGQGARARGR
jgi:hypothetical protein